MWPFRYIFQTPIVAFERNLVLSYDYERHYQMAVSDDYSTATSMTMLSASLPTVRRVPPIDCFSVKSAILQSQVKIQKLYRSDTAC